jgi:hypothetical protein
MVDWTRQFYKAHAQLLLGAEQRLANGVAWRLLTDRTTRLAIPRVTWMPDRRAMQRANRLLDALHGCALLEYFDSALRWHGMSKYEVTEGLEKDTGRVPETFARDRFIWQPSQDVIAITYATSRLLSYAGVRVYASEGVGMLIGPKGYVLDLDKQKVYAAQGCWEDSSLRINGLFRFADLLEVCDAESKEKFFALWEKYFEAVERTTAFKRERYARDCKDSMWSPATLNAFSLHLTPDGLAVFSTGFSPNSAKYCLTIRTVTNPIIIPYRELEPLMKPGPWRDELLGTAARQR